MVSSEPNNRASKLDKGQWEQVREACPNYCRSGIMSRCGAGPDWHHQKKCRFYQKSTISNRCMHYIEALDGHCDSVQAQRDSAGLLCNMQDDMNC